jgi:hypothetical protein
MHPDMLGQMVQLEQTRRLHAAELATARRSARDDEDAARVRRPGRVARLLAMRPHGHCASVHANPALVS